MNSVKSLDINLLVMHVDNCPSERQKTIVKILKGRTENNGGKLTVRYEQITGKIQGMEFDKVYYDEVSGVGDR